LRWRVFLVYFSTTRFHAQGHAFLHFWEPMCPAIEGFFSLEFTRDPWGTLRGPGGAQGGNLMAHWGPQGAPLAAPGGLTCALMQAKRSFFCKVSVSPAPEHQLARLGATGAPLGRPSGFLGRPWGVPRGALGPSLWTFLHQGLSTTLLLTNSEVELLRI
jgi:hypothetical protein